MVKCTDHLRNPSGAIRKKSAETSPDPAPSSLTLNICDDPILPRHRPPTRHLFARRPRGAPDPSPGDGFWPRHRQHTPDRHPLARRLRRDKPRRIGSRPCPVHSPSRCPGDNTRDSREHDGDRGGREAPALPTRWSTTPAGDTQPDRSANHRRQCMLAGGLGGTSGDMFMHSLDTVKTRQQGDPHMPPKYSSLGASYYKIFRQEGVRRGLYGGWLPALLGSFPGTVLFFGTYEFSKRHMLQFGVQEHAAYLASGGCTRGITRGVRKLTLLQVSWGISRRPSSMCHQRYSRLVSSCRVDSTTRTLRRGTTTGECPMPCGPSSDRRASPPSFTVIRLRSTAISHFRPSNSCFTSKPRAGPAGGSRVETLDGRWSS